jgi:hypothetical protein
VYTFNKRALRTYFQDYYYSKNEPKVNANIFKSAEKWEVKV